MAWPLLASWMPSQPFCHNDGESPSTAACCRRLWVGGAGSTGLAPHIGNSGAGFGNGWKDERMRMLRDVIDSISQTIASFREEGQALAGQLDVVRAAFP